MLSAGIIGGGFVGSAIYYGSNRSLANLLVYDIRDIGIPITPLEEICHRCPIIFICVPTPTDFEALQVDTSIVENVLEKIAEQKQGNIVIIKSTLPPGTSDRLAEKYSLERLFFSPEFLREVSYIEDYKYQDRIIIGCPPGDTKKEQRLITSFFEDSTYNSPPIYFTSRKIAETVKYITNAFLATKVSFFNEVRQFCDSAGVDYDIARSFVLLDKRIGQSHTKVPGPDGDFGWGLSCFPKDLCGFRGLLKSLGIDPTMMNASWNKNLEVRKNQDWMEMEKANAKKGKK